MYTLSFKLYHPRHKSVDAARGATVHLVVWSVILLAGGACAFLLCAARGVSRFIACAYSRTVAPVRLTLPSQQQGRFLLLAQPSGFRVRALLQGLLPIRPCFLPR